MPTNQQRDHTTASPVAGAEWARPGSGPGLDAKPFSIRLTVAEKAELLKRAGRVPLSTYVRTLILADDKRSGRRGHTAPAIDQDAIARVLATLGQSDLATNLRELVRMAHAGILPVGPETEEALRAAASATLAMRWHLMQALGLSEGEAP